MAYRFNGTSNNIFFSAAPLNSYSNGAITLAIYLKRTALSTFDDLLGIFDSSSGIRAALYASSSNAMTVYRSVNGNTGPTLGSTTAWYLLAVTFNASGNYRYHVHDGSSWSHTAAGVLSSVAIASSGDRIGISTSIAAGFFAGDVVCAGIKKSDSADATIETLSRTSFDVWRGFGFDWLVGFDTSLQSAGVLQDQATPGTGDQISINGTSVVSDPPSWSWTSVVTPVADFTGTPLTGTRPLNVAFTDTSTNTPTSWAWTFGDGGTSSAQNPSHTYATAGTYTVTLVATNAAGSDTKTRTGYVTAANPAGTLTKIKWGTDLVVTDEGAGVIEVDVDTGGAFAFFNG